MARKMSKRMLHFNLVMTFVWMALGIPTAIWWKQSILWVALMSLYANVVGHWSAYQASRAEIQGEKNGNSAPQPEGKTAEATT